MFMLYTQQSKYLFYIHTKSNISNIYIYIFNTYAVVVSTNYRVLTDISSYRERT